MLQAKPTCGVNTVFRKLSVTENPDFLVREFDPVDSYVGASINGCADCKGITIGF